jgi:hypothetical protein
MKHQDIVEFCIPLLYLVVNVILDDKKVKFSNLNKQANP